MNNRPDHRKYTFKPKHEPGLGDDIPCSKCGAVALDTGLECDECGHDMAPELNAEPKAQAQADPRQAWVLPSNEQEK